MGKGKQQFQPKKIRVFVEFERRSRGQLEALFLSDYRACLCQWRVTGTRPAAVPRTSVSFVSSWWVALLLCHGDSVLWSRWLVRVGPPAALGPDRRPPAPVTACPLSSRGPPLPRPFRRAEYFKVRVRHRRPRPPWPTGHAERPSRAVTVTVVPAAPDLRLITRPEN